MASQYSLSPEICVNQTSQVTSVITKLNEDNQNYQNDVSSPDWRPTKQPDDRQADLIMVRHVLKPGTRVAFRTAGEKVSDWQPA